MVRPTTKQLQQGADTLRKYFGRSGMIAERKGDPVFLCGNCGARNQLDPPDERASDAWLAEAIKLADQYANGDSHARLTLHMHLAGRPLA